KSLHQAPLLLPLEDSPLRRALSQWFAKLGVVPNVVAEFEDGALLKVFGAEGLGLFPGPAAVIDPIRAQYHVDLVGTTDAVTERFYAISVERRLRNPAVVAICEAARHELFNS
ncbi:MAG TPA: LysR substrate-binding domain-containing protein, partial [Polyangiaceae bacterium]|nr:LysR substrate-binding domain-containing protein [Polyangiaceae bacterium]